MIWITSKALIAEIESQNYDVENPTSKNTAVKIIRGRGTWIIDDEMDDEWLQITVDNEAVLKIKA